MQVDYLLSSHSRLFKFCPTLQGCGSRWILPGSDPPENKPTRIQPYNKKKWIRIRPSKKQPRSRPFFNFHFNFFLQYYNWFNPDQNSWRRIRNPVSGNSLAMCQCPMSMSMSLVYWNIIIKIIYCVMYNYIKLGNYSSSKIATKWLITDKAVLGKPQKKVLTTPLELSGQRSFFFFLFLVLK